jgi:uncharacterized delta-60 repeat protein
MKKILMLSALLLAVIVPPAARAETGETDASFGSGGRVATGIDLGVPFNRARVRVATGPAGRIVVGAESSLVAYNEDGQLDQTFGNGGFLSIATPGAVRFRLTDLGIDPEGRIVAVGTVGDGRLSQVAIFRYLPSGAPDLGFGGGDGNVLTDRSMTAWAGEVDAEGRIVVAAGPGEGSRPCRRADGPRRDPLVMRLNPDGSRDFSFGKFGVQRLAPLERVVTMAPTPRGGFVFAGPSRRDCGRRPLDAVIRLREDGSRVGRFGERGVVRFESAIASAAVDTRGRIVVVFAATPHGHNEEETVVQRLLPGGQDDRAFYGGGIGFRDRGHFQWKAVPIRDGDRPILVGTLSLPNGIPPSFIAAPMRESGPLEWEASSWRGWEWKERLGRGSRTVASAGLIDARGRLLVVGTVNRSPLAPQGGFALVRFELS